MLRRRADTKVGSQAGDKDVCHGSAPKASGEAGVAQLKGVVESRVHLQIGPLALVDDGVQERGVHIRDQCGTGGALDAVGGPQGGGVGAGGVRGVVDGGGGREGGRRGVIGGKRDMVSWVMISRGELDGEREAQQGVDSCRDGASVWDGEGAVLRGR